MVGKFLLTLAVIAIAFLVLKRRHDAADDEQRPKASSRNTSESKKGEESAYSSDFKLAAYMFLTMMIGAAVILYYQRWQDDHTVLTVNLFSGNDSASVSYQVYKYQLDTRSFTTVDGAVITVADNERMEVLGLD